MAYTRVWSEATPTGAEAANTIDDWFRYTKVDLRERLADIFGIANFADDPLRPTTLKFAAVANGSIYGATNILISDPTAATTWAKFDTNGLSVEKLNALAGDLKLASNLIPDVAQTLGVLTTRFPNAYLEKINLSGITEVVGKVIAGNKLSVANGATGVITTGTMANLGGLIIGLEVTAGAVNSFALFNQYGTTTQEINDPTITWSNTAGTASSNNVYVSGGSLLIQNMRGGPRDYYFLILGVYV